MRIGHPSGRLSRTLQRLSRTAPRLFVTDLSEQEDVEDSDDDGTEQRRDDAYPLQREIKREGDVRLDERATKHCDQGGEQQSTCLAPCQPLGDPIGGDGDDQEDDQVNEI